MQIAATDPEFQCLRTVCAEIGADPLLIQGGGGNASLKVADAMLIKASGTWMSDAVIENIFVEVSVSTVRSLIDSGASDFSVAVIAPQASGRRPSIETALHALMPFGIVLHAHAVNTICSTLVPGADHRLEQCLKGLSWARVPYTMPGADLAHALKKIVHTRAPDIIILDNHGIVLGADTAQAAHRLLIEIEDRLRFAPSALSAPPTLTALRPEVSGYRWLDANQSAHALAWHPERAACLLAGALMPDQVVYLGGPVVWLDALSRLPDLSASWHAERGTPIGCVIVRDQGVLVPQASGAAAESMIALLLEIALRLPVDARPTHLSLADERALSQWDAEAYRQAQDALRAQR